MTEVLRPDLLAGIRTVAVHPGTATPAGEVAEVAAYLASPAGAYYSGCRFDLGVV